MSGMKRAEREYVARCIVYSAMNYWPVLPTRLSDGRVLVRPGGPELTVEVIAGLAYTERLTDGRPPGGGWVPPVEAVKDAVAVLRGMAIPNDDGPRAGDAGAARSSADDGDANSQSTVLRSVGGAADQAIDAAVRRHPAGRKRGDR